METNTIVYERGPLNFKKCHYDGVRIRCLEFSNEGVGSFEEEEVGYSEIEMISEDKLPSLEVWCLGGVFCRFFFPFS